MAPLVIGGGGLGIKDVALVARHRRPVAIAPEVWPRLQAARVVVERWAAGDAPVYGLNTGLGGNLGHRLSPGEIADFQAQLIRGRAVGLGPPLPAEVVRAALLVRANGIARGASGVSPPVLAMLVELLNRGVVPVVPCHGSIGAADLVPMAHIGLVLLGRGEAELADEVLPGGEALARVGLAPVELQAKDGLGLINASALTAGHAALVLSDARPRISPNTCSPATWRRASRGCCRRPRKAGRGLEREPRPRRCRPSRAAAPPVPRLRMDAWMPRATAARLRKGGVLGKGR